MTTPGAQAALAAELRRTRQQPHPRHGDTPPNRPKPSTWEMRLAIRRASLRRVITSRKLHRQNLGDAPGWVSVILNLVHCEGGKTDDRDSINRVARRLGLPSFGPDAFAVVAGGVFGRRLMPAAQCGALIDLTTLEREELGILDIDASDEPADMRKKRLAKERQQKHRGAPAQAAAPSIRSQQPWVALGIAERTYWRHKAAGKLA